MNVKFQYWFFILFAFLYFLTINKFFGVTLEELQKLDPNALGDFLAGTFSPLAFLFLILGYLQNSKNLNQNTDALSQQAIALQQQSEALKMQAEELKISNQALQAQVTELQNSVQQQMHQVRISEEQLEYYRSKDFDAAEKEVFQARPILYLERYRTGTSGDSFRLTNVGGEAMQLDSDCNIHIPNLVKGSPKAFELPYNSNNIIFNYTDKLGNKYHTQFTSENNRNCTFIATNIQSH